VTLPNRRARRRARRKGTTEGGSSRGPSLSSFLPAGSVGDVADKANDVRWTGRKPALGSRSDTASPTPSSPSLVVGDFA
jgi:hypothetical protein